MVTPHAIVVSRRPQRRWCVRALWGRASAPRLGTSGRLDASRAAPYSVQRFEMTSRRRIRRAVAILIAVAAASSAARADEGFWPFTSIPHQKIRAAYGADLSDAWLNHLQRSVVKFPGGSGVFVSPDGLVLTNHHVALNTLTTLSSSARNLVGRRVHGAEALGRAACARPRAAGPRSHRGRHRRASTPR